jgi:hypothetical protein
MLILFSISVYAQEPEQYYKINDQININVPCYTATNEYCPATTICNLTIIDPKSDQLVYNQPMTYNIGYFNYTFSPTVLGDYSVYSLCTDAGDTGAENFKIQINNVGNKIENMLPMLIFYIILITIVMILLGAAINAESPMMLPLMLLLTMVFSWTFFYIYMHTISLNRIYYVIYWFFIIASVAIFFIILWIATIWAINSFSQKGRQKKDLSDNF